MKYRCSIEEIEGESWKIKKKNQGGIQMKNMIERAKFVCGGEEGASNVEIIIWITVVLVIATALFVFRDSITGFLKGSSDAVDGLNGEQTKEGYGVYKG